MRDKDLETKLRLVTLQLENWKRLHDLITYGLDKAKPIISTEQERQFTEIRANLLQEIEYVLRELNMLADVSGNEVRGEVVNMPARGMTRSRLGGGCARYFTGSAALERDPFSRG